MSVTGGQVVIESSTTGSCIRLAANPVLPFTRYMILDKLYNLSKTYFSYL